MYESFILVEEETEEKWPIIPSHYLEWHQNLTQLQQWTA